MFAKMGDHYEINASSKNDLIKTIGYLINQWGGGRVTGRSKVASDPKLAGERLAELKTAFLDKEGDSFQLLGAAIADEIREAGDREGFARKCLVTGPVEKGADPRIRVRIKDIMAWVVTTDVTVQENRIRQRYVYPPIFSINSLTMIESKEIEHAGHDILEEKFNDASEATYVREDRLMRTMMDRTLGLFNPITWFATLTPQIFAQVRNRVWAWSLVPTTCLLAADLWNDISAGAAFSDWFDPVHKHELILEGYLGDMMGCQIITDGFRYETLRVLDPGEMYILAHPTRCGAIQELKPLDAKATDQYNLGRAARGWFLELIEALSFTNARACAKASRV